MPCRPVRFSSATTSISLIDFHDLISGFILGLLLGRLDDVFLGLAEECFPFVHQRLFQGLFEVLRRLYAPEAQQQADENNCEGKLDERERG